MISGGLPVADGTFCRTQSAARRVDSGVPFCSWQIVMLVSPVPDGTPYRHRGRGATLGRGDALSSAAPATVTPLDQGRAVSARLSLAQGQHQTARTVRDQASMVAGV